MLTQTWTWWLLGAAALVVATIAHLRFWTARLLHPLEYDTTERIKTRDGSAFELRRIAATPPQKPEFPVLIVHGLAANHRNDDLDEQHSLARHLARSGRDVWLITLRTGRSDRTRAEDKKANFSAMVAHDVPDAIAAVLERTGATQLDYIGFSMGGMLAYASIGGSVAPDNIRRVVIIGSPGRVRIPLPLLHRIRGLPNWIAPPSPFRFLSRLYAFAAEAFTTPIHRIPINPDNLAPGILRRTMVNMVEDVPIALNRELGKWALSDGQIRVDDQPVLPRLGRLTIPVRFYAGAADHVAPPGSVRHAYEAWGGTDKAFTTLGTAFGHSADYGHGDLAVGKNAAAEIFTPIEQFLAETTA